MQISWDLAVEWCHKLVTGTVCLEKLGVKCLTQGHSDEAGITAGIEPVLVSHMTS